MLSLRRRKPGQELRTGELVPAEIFRDLYTRILMSTGLGKQLVLGVTSAIDGEGKTTTALNLATMLAEDGALAEAGRRIGTVLLIDCHATPASTGPALGVPPAPGLIHYLQGECALGDAIKPTSVRHLSVLPVGGGTRRFPSLIRMPAMFDMVQDLRARFDLIILDLPSLLTTTDTQVLTSLADHLVLVVRAGVTPTKLIEQALEAVDQEKLLGTVLNEQKPDLPGWLDRWL
jgi:Mrp family chromosome partitioning ATPase